MFQVGELSRLHATSFGPIGGSGEWGEVVIEYCHIADQGLPSCPVYLSLVETRVGGAGQSLSPRLRSAMPDALQQVELHDDEIRALATTFPELECVNLNTADQSTGMRNGTTNPMLAPTHIDRGLAVVTRVSDPHGCRILQHRSAITQTCLNFALL